MRKIGHYRKTTKLFSKSQANSKIGPVFGVQQLLMEPHQKKVSFFKLSFSVLHFVGSTDYNHPRLSSFAARELVFFRKKNGG